MTAARRRGRAAPQRVPERSRRRSAAPARSPPAAGPGTRASRLGQPDTAAGRVERAPADVRGLARPVSRSASVSKSPPAPGRELPLEVDRAARPALRARPRPARGGPRRSTEPPSPARRPASKAGTTHAVYAVCGSSRRGQISRERLRSRRDDEQLVDALGRVGLDDLGVRPQPRLDQVGQLGDGRVQRRQRPLGALSAARSRATTTRHSHGRSRPCEPAAARA